MKTAFTFEQIENALAAGNRIFGKDSIGDWIQVDAFRYENGKLEARVADALSGLNSEIIGCWLQFRDYEIE